MINRLQFLHKSKLFKTREEAIKFLDDLRITRPSLYAEPVVVKYGDEEKPNVILAIGATGSGTSQPTLDTSYFMIDAQGIKDDIKVKYDEIEHALAKLAFAIVDTDTLDLEKVETEDSITLKGNVKVPEEVAIKDKNITNIIKKSENGLYSYVNLKFDDKTNTFTFQVNEDVNTFAIPVIESGKYDISKEAIVFTFTDGTTTEVDVDDLIDEWTTEGDNSKTPIVLTKERHTDKGTDMDDRNGDHWKDVLKADVRIASDKEHNILEKTTDGRNLYVKGTADNIYFKDGKNVKEAIEGIKTEVSSAYTNNIIFKDYTKNNGEYNGIAANVDVEYTKETNTLVFKHSNNNGDIVSKEFKLNSAAFINDISYDTVKETITIRYKDEDGKEQKTDIELSSLLDDWVTNSDGHNVELNKQVKAGEKDVLTADVKLTEKTADNYQILEQRDNTLYVKGTADNIHYKGNENVNDALDRLENSLADETENLNKLSGSSYFEVGDTDTVAMRKDADATSHTVTADVKVSPKDKNTILVDGNNGLYASFDYDAKRNVIIISDTNSDTHKKEIQLNSVSVIEYMRYDKAREVIIIGYKSNASLSETHTLEIPITDVLSEWETNNKSHNVRLVKTQHAVDGTDDLSGDVVLATEGNYSDNLIREATMTAYGEEMKGLYVSGNEVNTSARAIAKDEAKSASDKAIESAKTYTDSVHEAVTSEINTAKENGVSEANTYTDNKLRRYDHDLHDELSTLSASTVSEAVTSSNRHTDEKASDVDTKAQGYASDAERKSKAYADGLRQTSKDEISQAKTNLQQMITTETNERASGIADVNNKVSQETSARTAADDLINTNLANEANTRQTADNNLQKNIDKEASDRAKADTALQTSITAETTARENNDNLLDSKISTTAQNAKTYTDTKATETLGTASAYTDAQNVSLSGAIKDYVDKEVGDITLVGDATKTATVNVTDKKIAADVRIASGDKNRIIANADGLYVGDISAAYNAQTNTLTINGLNGQPVLTQKLNSASFIDSINYNEDTHYLNITYHTTEESSVTTVPVNLTGLIKDTKADETSNTPIEITVSATSENGVSVNKIKGDVNIADNIKGNILRTVTQSGKGALYADASDILSDISALSATTKSLSDKTDGDKEKISKIETSAGFDNEGNYIHSDKPYISDATSLADADKKLADAVASVDKSITNLMQGSKTYSVNVFTEKDDNTDASLLKADVRLSVANGQQESELTRTEMPNEGNLLQVVKAKSNGVAIELGEKINGLYFGGSIDYGMMEGDDTLNG